MNPTLIQQNTEDYTVSSVTPICQNMQRHSRSAQPHSFSISLNRSASPVGLPCRIPLHAIKEISRDQTYQWRFKLANGKSISAIDLQREYLALAQKHLNPQSGDTDWVLTEWESTLDRLEKDPMELTDRLDWVAKKWLLETFIDEERLTWDDPWLQSLDLEYHNIDQEEGLYYELETSGLMRRLVTDRQIESAIHNPPADTRAYFRGKIVG